MHRRPAHEDMTFTARAYGFPDESYQSIAGLYRIRIGAGLSSPARAVDLARRDPGDTDARSLGAPDRAVAVPDAGRRAGKGLAGRNDGDHKGKHGHAGAMGVVARACPARCTATGSWGRGRDQEGVTACASSSGVLWQWRYGPDPRQAAKKRRPEPKPGAPAYDQDRSERVDCSSHDLMALCAHAGIETLVAVFSVIGEAVFATEAQLTFTELGTGTDPVRWRRQWQRGQQTSSFYFSCYPSLRGAGSLEGFVIENTKDYSAAVTQRSMCRSGNITGEQSPCDIQTDGGNLRSAGADRSTP